MSELVGFTRKAGQRVVVGRLDDGRFVTAAEWLPAHPGDRADWAAALDRAQVVPSTTLEAERARLAVGAAQVASMAAEDAAAVSLLRELRGSASDLVAGVANTAADAVGKMTPGAGVLVLAAAAVGLLLVLK